MRKMGAAGRKPGRASGKKRRKREVRIQIAVTVGLFFAVAVLVGYTANAIRNKAAGSTGANTPKVEDGKYNDKKPDIDVLLLTVNEYSRPGTELKQVKGIVVHYTGNPGTTARQNRDYFEGLATSHDTYASSHFVVGLGGEIIQCVPCNEMAYASNDRNSDTISIECCIADDSGRFSDPTYQSLIELVTWLMGRYDLTVDDVIRHYDVTGKICPKYFVEHEAAWDNFKDDLVQYINKHGVKKEV